MDAIRCVLQRVACNPQPYALFQDLGKADFANVGGTLNLRARELWDGPIYYLIRSNKETAMDGTATELLLID